MSPAKVEIDTEKVGERGVSRRKLLVKGKKRTKLPRPLSLIVNHTDREVEVRFPRDNAPYFETEGRIRLHVGNRMEEH